MLVSEVLITPGVANPVNVAHKLFQESSRGCLSLGRVPPL